MNDFKCESEVFNGPKCKVQCQACKTIDEEIKSSDIEGCATLEELIAAVEAKGYRVTSAGPREGTVGGSQGARAGGRSDIHDAGSAQVQLDATVRGGGRDAGGSRDHARSGEASASFYDGRVIEFDYMSYRGVMEQRRAVPRYLWYGISEYYADEGPQWFIVAVCLDRQSERHFKLANIAYIDKADDQSLPWRS